MASQEDIQQKAVDTVMTLMARRLDVGGVSTSRPDFYCQCEAGEPQAYEGGTEVRVKTWRHWSDALVKLDGKNGRLIGYSLPGNADPKNEKEIGQEEAIEAVAQALTIPGGAVLSDFYHMEYGPGWKVARLEWIHIHEDLPVDGDLLMVDLHPETGRIVEYLCLWREVRLRGTAR